jgi:PIN domain nuclease of toxin-antitoxin system
MQVAGTVESYLEEVTSRVAVRPITPKAAALANQFPPSYSSDPCDRLIGATALAEGMVLITKDANIRACKMLQTIW